MDTGKGEKKESKKRQLFKEESEPSTKRWLRSDAKKSSENAGDGVNSDCVENKPKLDNGKGEGTVANELGDKTILDLPDELLEQIIKTMVPKSQWTSLESVSHQFRDVVHGLWANTHEIRLDELVYNEEKKKENPYEIVEAVLEKFLVRSPKLASISGFAVFCNQRESNIESDSESDTGSDNPISNPIAKPISIRLGTVLVLSKFQHLKSIDFSGREVISRSKEIDFTGRDVITASNLAVFLKLSASRQCWKSVDINGGIFGDIEPNQMVGSQENQPALNLEYYKFNGSTVFNFDRLLPIDWSRLKKLVIIESYECAEKVLSIIRQCSQLVHLEVEVHGIKNGQPSYGEFMQAVANLENLSVLKMNPYYSPGKDCHVALLALIQDLGRREIADFSLTGEDCTEEICGAIIQYLPRLKSLELDFYPRDASSPLVLRLANEMNKLETLKIRCRWSSNLEIDGAVIRAIVANMINLKCLHLKNIDAADLECLGDLRKLKELVIRRKLIKSETMETWARLGFGSSLETLDLWFLDDTPTETVVTFFKNLPRLTRLRLEGATDGVLDIIGRSCPNLVELELRDFELESRITTNGMQSLIDRCSQLKILKLWGQIFAEEEEEPDNEKWFPTALTVAKYRKITFIGFLRRASKSGGPSFWTEFTCG